MPCKKLYPVTLAAVFITAAIILAGCAMPQKTPTLIPLPTRTPLLASPTPRPSRTVVPSITPTSTPLPSATPGPTATLSTDFSGARMAGTFYSADWRTTTIAVETLPNIKGEFTATLEGFPYECRTAKRPLNRLYCTGHAVGVEKRLHLEVFEKETQRLVYATDFMIPLNSVIPSAGKP